MAPKKAKKAVKKNVKPSASQVKAEKNVSLASIKMFLK